MIVPAADSFADLARQASAVLGDLQAQLEVELVALQQHDLDALRGSTESKQQLLARFSELNRERIDLLSRLGVEANAGGVRGWLDSLPEAQRPSADAAWQQLQQELAVISRLNLRNEQVILRNSRNTDQLLNLLRGQNQTQTLYNASGTKGPSAAQNRLGKA
ncbi:MAG: flagellar protein FlgN [Oceanospirillaceae bacterium]|nr:flagellar protein FlgN [Oceanospirillaceae bacterium]